MEWQTIETVPKDRTIVLLSDGRYVTAGLYDAKRPKYPWVVLDDSVEDCVNGWQDNDWGPKFWAPLPPAK